MELMRVTAGTFLMGLRRSFLNNLQRQDWMLKTAQPQHVVDIPYDYWMARFPATETLYDAYVRATGYKALEWIYEGLESLRSWDAPVGEITWKEAMAYCKWLSDLVKDELPPGFVLRLPTEAEWEKAARGTDGRESPWGNQFDKNNCNSSEGGKNRKTPVGSYSPQGDSPYGCADMAGNVQEWTHSLYKAYPYVPNDGREDEGASGTHVQRVLQIVRQGFGTLCLPQFWNRRGDLARHRSSCGGVP